MNEEMLRMAQTAQSVDELLTMAKDNGVVVTEKQAREYFERIHASGELADDELDAVSGGCGDDVKKPYCSVCGTALGSITQGTSGYVYYCPKCDKKEPRIKAVMK